MRCDEAKILMEYIVDLLRAGSLRETDLFNLCEEKAVQSSTYSKHKFTEACIFQLMFDRRIGHYKEICPDCNTEIGWWKLC